MDLTGVDDRYQTTVPDQRKPQRLFDDKATAERELLRLSAKYQGNDFYLFEATAKTVKHQTNGIFYVEPINK